MSMTEVTITEALAEIGTITSRIEKKRSAVLSYLSRRGSQRDPLAKDGGSEKFVAAELQAIKDLEERIVSIRRAVAAANAATAITVGDQTRSISDWLTWRRDVSDTRRSFYALMVNSIENARKTAQQKGAALVTNAEQARDEDVVVSLNEGDLRRDIEAHEEILGKLDGQLSLKNATVLIRY